MDLSEIRNHWQKAGEELSLTNDVTATSRDPFLGQLERENISKYLNRDGDAVEIGCGDASHTVHYAQRVRSIAAVDVAESLIELAKERARRAGISNASFRVASVLDLNDAFDAKHRVDWLISQRCLINLPDWQYQRDAITQIHRLLKPNGLFLMTEGFQEEFENLNLLRHESGLVKMKVVDYNLNLRHKEFDGFIEKYFHVEKIVDYGFYLFISRLFHPLAVLPKQPEHDSRLNRVAMQIASFVDPGPFKKYSYNLFYVLRKR